MKNYHETFQKLKSRKEGALMPFTVIGYPNYSASLKIALAMVSAGADMLELGLPFSDPIADGPTIQAANNEALANGMNTDKVFGFVRELRKKTDVPIGLLAYYNLIYQRGTEKFYRDARESGVNSVLIADMPVEEFDEVMNHSKKNNIDAVLMASPLSGSKRIKKIAEMSTGFIYAVSRLGVTGARAGLDKTAVELIKKIRKATDKPICLGFGISRPENVQAAINAGADGAIVGSAVIDLIRKCKGEREMLAQLSDYISSLKKATLK